MRPVAPWRRAATTRRNRTAASGPSGGQRAGTALNSWARVPTTGRYAYWQPRGSQVAVNEIDARAERMLHEEQVRADSVLSKLLLAHLPFGHRTGRAARLLGRRDHRQPRAVAHAAVDRSGASRHPRLSSDRDGGIRRLLGTPHPGDPRGHRAALPHLHLAGLPVALPRLARPRLRRARGGAAPPRLPLPPGRRYRHLGVPGQVGAGQRHRDGGPARRVRRVRSGRAHLHLHRAGP